MIQHDQFNQECFGTFAIIAGCGLVTYCGEGLVVALHGVRNPNAAYCCLAQHTRSLVLVARFLLSSCMTYAVNCPCGKELIVVLSQSPSLARGLLSPSLARGLLWPSSMDATSFGELALLALNNVHAVFGILNVLAFGNVYVVDNVHTIFSFGVLDLGVFASLIVALHGMVIVAFCKQQQHEILIVAWKSDQSSLAFACCCHCFLRYDNKKWLSHHQRSHHDLAVNLLTGDFPFLIVNVVDLHWWKRLAVDCAILRIFAIKCCCRRRSLLQHDVECDNSVKDSAVPRQLLASSVGHKNVVLIIVLGWESCRHVGGMLPRQPNVGTFCPNAPVVATQFDPDTFFCVGICQHPPNFPL